MHWAALLGIAVASDILDYLGGFIPIIGDVLDLLTTAILFPYLGRRSAIGLVELVPGADFLPTYTLLALWKIWEAYEDQGKLEGLDVSRKADLPVTDTV